MKEQAFDIKNICTCNRLFNEKTLHPLVSVIKLTRCSSEHQIQLDSYSVLLTKCHKDDLTYGHQHYDFSDGTLLFRAPQKTIDFDLCSSGTLLVFHPDLIKCTYLGQIIKQYSFFRYKRNESLHLSCNEKRIVKRILDDIAGELKWGVDIYSHNLINNHIEMLLNYCQRFYTRQFITRHEWNQDVIRGMEQYLDSYMTDGRIATEGIPSACCMASAQKMSINYLNDMLKKETGKGFNDYMEQKRISVAKRMLMEDGKSIEQIVRTLGYCSTAYFDSLFKKITGVSPEQYKES